MSQPLCLSRLCVAVSQSFMCRCVSVVYVSLCLSRLCVAVSQSLMCRCVSVVSVSLCLSRFCLPVALSQCLFLTLFCVAVPVSQSFPVLSVATQYASFARLQRRGVSVSRPLTSPSPRRSSILFLAVQTDRGGEKKRERRAKRSLEFFGAIRVI